MGSLYSRFTMTLEFDPSRSQTVTRLAIHCTPGATGIGAPAG